MPKIADGFCHMAGCGRETMSKKAVVCRPCAVAVANGRYYSYAEPCRDYQRLPTSHLDHSCGECGFDSAEHPGGGRLRPQKLVFVE